MNYKVTVAYDGTRYNGWQKQGDTDNTIQTKIEAVLGRLTGEDVAAEAALSEEESRPQAVQKNAKIRVNVKTAIFFIIYIRSFRFCLLDSVIILKRQP